MEKSVLAKNVTMYQRANTPDKLHQVSLLDVLQSQKYKPLADECSGISDKKDRQSFKLLNVPVITPSGEFNGRRKAENLLLHSGLICLDLDGVKDTESLKQKVSELSFVAYCGKSISGSGLFAIVRIPQSSLEEHKRRYAALEHYFIKKFGIVGAVDPQPKNVSACRYVSYDPDPYFNHVADIFTGIDEPHAVFAADSPNHYQNRARIPSRRYSSPCDYEKVSEMVEYIHCRKLDFCPEYDDYIRVAFSLATLGESGRHLFHSVCQYSPTYNKHDADAKFTDALKNGNNRISLGTFFGMCVDYGLMAQKDTWVIIKPKPLKERNRSDISDTAIKTLQSTTQIETTPQMTTMPVLDENKPPRSEKIIEVYSLEDLAQGIIKPLYKMDNESDRDIKELDEFFTKRRIAEKNIAVGSIQLELGYRSGSG